MNPRLEKPIGKVKLVLFQTYLKHPNNSGTAGMTVHTSPVVTDQVLASDNHANESETTNPADDTEGVKSTEPSSGYHISQDLIWLALIVIATGALLISRAYSTRWPLGQALFPAFCSAGIVGLSIIGLLQSHYTKHRLSISSHLLETSNDQPSWLVTLSILTILIFYGWILSKLSYLLSTTITVSMLWIVIFARNHNKRQLLSGICISLILELTLYLVFTFIIHQPLP